MNKSEDSHVRLRERLQQRRSENRYRTLVTVDEVVSSRTVRIDDKEFLNFSSNDYLNLSGHSLLKERSREYTELYGTSSSSSRLITGTLHIHRDLEKKIAALYQKEASLLFSTGFQANSTILPAITEKNDVIIADELCHNSILIGCMASRAKFYRFRHNDLSHLETFLKRKSGTDVQDIWIATESLFSMDGDRAPLAAIIDLASEYSAKLYVDDAHALGVFGEKGLGFGRNHPEIDLLISTFGKAAGSFGAFAASSKTVIDSLVNYCSGFIYTTALPPSVVGAIDAALELIPGMNSEREHLHGLIDYLHSGLKEMDLNTSPDPSHILPVIFDDEEAVLGKSQSLRDKELLATAIRPPTVPKNQSRFRISLTSAHQKKDCEKLLWALQ